MRRLTPLSTLLLPVALFPVVLLTVALLTVALLAACRGDAGGTDRARLAPAQLKTASWDEVVADARDRDVRWFFWSGNPIVNGFVDD